ncbi:MAG: hypothetical protein HQK55_05270 [Deltaproteobacteria bacterium]|nr:hypothetical protein [Deltaproteobacteria bacterium]
MESLIILLKEETLGRATRYFEINKLSSTSGINLAALSPTGLKAWSLPHG